MKKMSIFLIFSLFTNYCFTQSAYIKNTRTKFDTQIFGSEVLSDGTVILYGDGSDETREKAGNPMFIKRINVATGEVLFSSNLSGDGLENGRIHGVKANPDGGYMVTGRKGYCNEFPYDGFLRIYNSENQFQFEQRGVLPGTDSLIIQYNGGGFIENGKYYGQTNHGIAVFSADHTFESQLFYEELGVATLDFIAPDTLLGVTDFGLVKKFLYPSGELISENGTIPTVYPSNSLRVKVLDNERNIIRYRTNSIVIWQENDITRYSTPTQDPETFTGKTFTSYNNEGQITICKIIGENTVAVTILDENFNEIENFTKLFPDFVLMTTVAHVNNELLFAGIEKTFLDEFSTFFSSEHQQLGYYQKHPFDGNPAFPITSVGVSNIVLSNPILQEKIFSENGVYYANKFTFTDTEVIVHNNGTEVITDFAVNTKYDSIPFNIYFCREFSFFQRLYTNQNIAPGDSLTFTIENLEIYKRDTTDFRLCLWTNGPNGSIDLSHDNDFHCTATFTTELVSSISEKNIEEKRITVLPNPVQNLLTLTGDFQKTDYQIFSTAGQRVLAGSLQDSQTVDVADLPAGLYFIRAAVEGGYASVKFVKL